MLQKSKFNTLYQNSPHRENKNRTFITLKFQRESTKALKQRRKLLYYIQNYTANKKHSNIL